MFSLPGGMATGNSTPDAHSVAMPTAQTTRPPAVTARGPTKDPSPLVSTMPPRVVHEGFRIVRVGAYPDVRKSTYCDVNPTGPTVTVVGSPT